MATPSAKLARLPKREVESLQVWGGVWSRNPPPLPTPNWAPGRSFCPKQLCWLVGFFLHLVCAKIPAAVEFQAKVVKAERWMHWRASPDDTGLLQSNFKSFNYFYAAKRINRQVRLQPYEYFSWILSFQKNHHQRQIVTFLGPTGILPMSCLPALVIQALKCICASGSTFCSRGHSFVPVILLHEYLHFSPFAQLPFSQIYANSSKTEAFSQVQDELGEVRSRGEEIPAGWNLAAPVPWTFVGPGFHLVTLFFLANLNILVDHG